MDLPSKSTRARGDAAEALAARHLARLGYLVVERNYRCRRGEIDLVAREGEVLVFVEVRSRADASVMDPAASVTPAKRARIVRAARHYLLARKTASQTPCRFDVVGITGARVELLRGAFTLDDLPPRGRGR